MFFLWKIYNDKRVKCQIKSKYAVDQCVYKKLIFVFMRTKRIDVTKTLTEI